MAEPNLGEIRLFSFGKTPRGWTPCDGQLLPISGNPALFSLLGAQFGGDGTTTFALPDLRKCVPVGANSTTYAQGNDGGAETVTLLDTNLPPHTHTVQASSTPATANGPSSARIYGAGSSSGNPVIFYTAASNLTGLASAAIGTAGNGTSHSNLQPYVALNFCIAISGVYPQHAD